MKLEKCKNYWFGKIKGIDFSYDVILEERLCYKIPNARNSERFKISNELKSRTLLIVQANNKTLDSIQQI